MGITIGIGSMRIGDNRESPLTYCTQRLITSHQIYTEEMDSSEGWVKDANSTLVVNEEQKKSGTGSLRITSIAGGTATLSKNVSWDIEDLLGLKFWVYFHSVPNLTADITVYASTDVTLNNYFRKAITYPENIFAKDQWVLFHLWPGVVGNPNNTMWDAVGNPNWHDIKYFRIKIISTSGQISDISFDLLKVGEVRKPAIVISFDGGFDNNYAAYQLMRAKKMVGTHYITSGVSGSTGRLTEAQLREMYNYGFDIANHTVTHAHFDEITPEQIAAELTGCKNYLDGLGFTRSSAHVAYPGGTVTDEAVTVMEAVGMKTGRGVTTYSWNKYDTGALQHLGWPFRLNASAPAPETTVAEMIAKIDYAISFNAVVHLYFHNLNVVVSEVYDWELAKFSALLDYIESIGLQTLTIDEYYRLYSGGITVRHK